MAYNSYRPLKPSGPHVSSGGGLAPRPPEPTPPPAPPPRRRGRDLAIAVSGVAFVALCVVLATNLVTRDSPLATAATNPTPLQLLPVATPAGPESDAPVAAPVHPKTLVAIDGKGAGRTQTFTTGTDWYLRYSYNCPPDMPESQNTVQIFEYSATNPGTMIVNESDRDGSDTLPQHGPPGPRYLRIVSECDWTVAVLG